MRGGAESHPSPFREEPSFVPCWIVLLAAMKVPRSRRSASALATAVIAITSGVASAQRPDAAAIADVKFVEEDLTSAYTYTLTRSQSAGSGREF